MKKVRISFALFPVIVFKKSTGKDPNSIAQRKFFNNMRKVPTPERTTLPKQPKLKELVA